MRFNRRLMTPLLFTRKGIRFLAKHEFNVDDAAPMASPYDGLTIVDVEGDKMSVASGVMTIAAQTTPVWGDEGFYSNVAYTRTNGLATFFKVNFSTVSFGLFGFSSAQNILDASLYGHSFYPSGGAISVTSGGPNVYPSITTGVDYVFVEVCRDSGRFMYLYDGTDWLLLWVDAIDSTATLYLAVSNYLSASTLDYARPAQLTPALTNPQISIAAPSVSDTGNTPDKDFFKESTLTAKPSAGNMDFLFRIQDATNYWQRRINSTGDVELNEIIAGASNLRGSSAAAVAGGEIERLRAYDEEINIYIGNALAVTYALAANFKAETAFEFDDFGTAGDENNVSIWQKTPTGAFLSELNAGKA